MPSEIEAEMLSVMLIGAVFCAVYVLSSRAPLFRTNRKVSPYTAGISYNGKHLAQVSNMVVFLSILLAAESLTVALFFVNVTAWTVLLFSAFLIAVVLGYYTYMEEEWSG